MESHIHALASSRAQYSQDVHDDAQRPHVTRLVIFLWT